MNLSTRPADQPALSSTWEAKLQPGVRARSPSAEAPAASHGRQRRAVAYSLSQESQNLGLKPSSATYSVTLDDLPRLGFLICQVALMISCPGHSLCLNHSSPRYPPSSFPPSLSLLSFHLFREAFPDLPR